MTLSLFQRTLTAALLLFMSLATPGCQSKKDDKPPPRPAVVSVASAFQRHAPLTLEAVGHVEATRTVNVRAQVTGTLLETLFVEGADIADGNLLMRIDPAPFEAKLRQAEAALSRDTVLAGQRDRDYRRYAQLVRQQVVSIDDYEKSRSSAGQAREQVRVDEAEVATARLNLGYCEIRSPVTGVAGYQRIKTGNLVNANTDTVVTINQIQPAIVKFTLSENDLPGLRRYLDAGPLQADVTGPGIDGVVSGLVTSINNAVDPQTGMILAQAECANTEKKLWPGQFVRVVVTLTTQPDALLVPTVAVLSKREGDFVFVVQADETVALKPVTVERRVDGFSLIGKGLTPGETVVTEGQIQLRPGMKVQARASDTPATPAPAGNPAPSPAEGARP